ncbi:MAG: monofunctional biosynthetic peptidoglycan transglycosylase [Bacteroidales bacterium]|nr:monofunctional biosynthetic peptidoglycan transglycosylase [Bacteroidales bacterium]
MAARTLTGRITRFLTMIISIIILLSVFLVVIFKWVPVWVTPLMLQQTIVHAKDPDYHTRSTWKSLEDISPELAKAVIASEDQKFLNHKGFDHEEIQNALEERRKGTRFRGASTISQQTAKNVFCWPSRTWIRKGIEAYFTFLIEKIWGKKRILEVYLNVAEMGTGIFGAEAAAQAHFGHSAAELTRREACQIAACLPDPRKRTAGKPSNYVSRRAGEISRQIGNLVYPDWITRK